MTGLPGGAFFVGVRGLAGAWRVLDGFLAGSWRAQICARKWLSRGGRVWLSKGVGEAGCSGMAGAGHAWGWMLGRLGLGVACYLSFCRLVLYAKPTTFAIVKTKATPPRGACYGINTNTHNHY